MNNPSHPALLSVLQPVLKGGISATCTSIKKIIEGGKAFSAAREFKKAEAEVSTALRLYKFHRRKLELKLTQLKEAESAGLMDFLGSAIWWAAPAVGSMLLSGFTALGSVVVSTLMGAGITLVGGFLATSTALVSLVFTPSGLVTAGIVGTLYGAHKLYKYFKSEPMGTEDDAPPVEANVQANHDSGHSAPPVEDNVQDNHDSGHSAAPAFTGKSVLATTTIKAKGYTKVYQRVQEWRTKLKLDDLEAKYGLPHGMLTSLMAQESQGNPKATSPVGAAGLFQFMPDTAEYFGIDPYDPAQSANAAAKYLARLYKRFGSWELALRAYNAGEGNISRFVKTGKNRAAQSKENREYAPRIAAHHEAMFGAPAQGSDTSSQSTSVRPVDPTARTAEPQARAEPFKPSNSVAGFIVPTTGTLTSKFGWRIHPIKRTRKFHKGVDIAGPVGTPVYAAAAGTVTEARNAGGAGLMIAIKHGTSQTRYMHNSQLLVKAGDTVTQGQLIAKMGSTGLSTGSHLHFEVWETMKEPSDPAAVIAGIPPGDKRQAVNLTARAEYEGRPSAVVAQNKNPEFYKTKKGIVKS